MPLPVPNHLSVSRWRGVAITTIVALAAIVAARYLWKSYMESPWTRDGRVRADIVSVAPDVAGLVREVDVRDNQTVKKGTVLFRIDPDRFRIALNMAQAKVLERYAEMMESRREAGRYERLYSGGNASHEKAETLGAIADESKARYQQALVSLSLAQLDLTRSKVVATVDGTVTNMHLRPGDFVKRGQGVIALVDADSFYVDGYFEETRLHFIHPGDPVEIRLMGDPRPLSGRVESIARSIEDRERHDRPGRVPDVNPTFSWVRLAQRIPVRIRIDRLPSNLHLVAGETATVIDRAGQRRIP